MKHSKMTAKGKKLSMILQTNMKINVNIGMQIILPVMTLKNFVLPSFVPWKVSLVYTGKSISAYTLQRCTLFK